MIFLAISFVIVCGLWSENAEGICEEELINEDKSGNYSEKFLNVSYFCDNVSVVFSLPNYTRDYILKGAVNEAKVLSLTVTPYNGASILVIKINRLNKPFNDAQVSVERDLYQFLQDYYPSSTSSPYHMEIDGCNGTVMKGITENPEGPFSSVFGVIYDQDPLGNSPEAFRRIFIKTILNERDFNELVNTFRLRDTK